MKCLLYLYLLNINMSYSLYHKINSIVNYNYNYDNCKYDILCILINNNNSYLCISDIIHILSTSKCIRDIVPVCFNSININRFTIFNNLFSTMGKNELTDKIFNSVKKIHLHSPFDDNVCCAKKIINYPPKLQLIRLNLYNINLIDILKYMQFQGMNIHINMKDHWSSFTFTPGNMHNINNTNNIALHHTCWGKIDAMTFFTPSEYQKYSNIQLLDFKLPSHCPQYHFCQCNFNNLITTIGDDLIKNNKITISHNYHNFSSLF